jgi:acylphosphatase
MDEILEMQAIVKGNVQGVGFRATVHHIAQKFELKGYAQNLRDGTVEIIAQGKKSDLDRLLHEVEMVFGPGYIVSIDTHYYQPTHQFPNFSIR